MKDSYLLNNIKRLGEGNFTFDVCGDCFRFSVHGQSNILRNELGMTIHLKNVSFLNEDIIFFTVGPKTLKSVMITQTYTLPISLIYHFFDMLQEQWCKPNGHNFSRDSLHEYVTKMYQSQPEEKIRPVRMYLGKYMAEPTEDTKEEKVFRYFVCLYGDDVTLSDVENFEDLKSFCQHHKFTKKFVMDTMRTYLQTKKNKFQIKK